MIGPTLRIYKNEFVIFALVNDCNLGKMVPVLGAVVGGAFDTTSTLAIASLAKKTFLEDGVAIGDGTVIDKKVLEVVPEENN